MQVDQFSNVTLSTRASFFSTSVETRTDGSVQQQERVDWEQWGRLLIGSLKTLLKTGMPVQSARTLVSLEETFSGCIQKESQLDSGTSSQNKLPKCDTPCFFMTSSTLAEMGGKETLILGLRQLRVTSPEV